MLSNSVTLPASHLPAASRPMTPNSQSARAASRTSPDPRDRRIRRIVAVSLLVGLGIVLALSSHPRARRLPLIAAAVRAPLPRLSLPLLNGQTWSLADHRGRVVLLNLWATWCAPCRQEMPTLARLAEQRSAAGLDVLGIAVDDPQSRPTVQSFLTQTPVSFPIALPTSNAAQQSSIGLPIAAVPTTLLIDRHGRVALQLVGAFDRTELERAVDQLLAEP